MLYLVTTYMACVENTPVCSVPAEDFMNFTFDHVDNTNENFVSICKE